MCAYESVSEVWWGEVRFVGIYQEYMEKMFAALEKNNNLIVA